MLKWAIAFFLVALIAAIFGFGGVATASAGIAKIIFFVFLGLALIGAIMAFDRGSRTDIYN
ncbi:MAG: DUF1328 domain-containing protein [Sphingomonadaceae bacterium]